MEWLTRVVVAMPRLTIALIAVVTAGLLWEARQLRLEVTLGDELPDDHPYTEIDRTIAARLGAAQTSLIAIAVRDGDVFTAPTLARIRRLTEGVQRIAGVVPGTVRSLVSPQVKRVTADGEGVHVGPLVDGIPDDSAALHALRETVFAHPLYVGNLVSADARGAFVVADFDDRASAEAVTHDLEALAAGERDGDTEVWVGGQSPALAALQHATRRIVWLVLLAGAVIAVVHFEAFRTLQAVVLPLTTAVLSLVWSMGLLGLLGFALTPWTVVTAVLVLSVAAGHAVQILKRYYECFDACHDNRRAVAMSIARIGPVMVTAGLVAAAGFASLVTFGVPAVRDFGLMAAFGIVSALAIELTFIPACRVLMAPPRRRETARERRHRLLDPALERIAHAVCTRPGRVVAGGVLAVAGIAVGIARLQVNTSFRSWFPPDSPMIVADREIRSRLSGTSTLRILVEGDAPEALLAPRAMAGMAALQDALREEPDVTATLSPADFVAVVNRAVHDGDPSQYRIPERRSLVAQELLLFGPDDLTRVLTADYRTAAILALARSDDVAWIEGVFARLRAVAREVLPPGVHARVAGGELAQVAAMNESVIREKLANMAQVTLVIFALSALVFRSLTAGLLVLVPLACASLVNLGVMGWVGSWLSFATATYTAAGLSLGADFAIYFLFRLREEAGARAATVAVRRALRTAGKAIFFVASAIAAGYATLACSDFALWRQLGLYVALMIATSALASVTLVPALVLLARPRFLGRWTALARSSPPVVDHAAAVPGDASPPPLARARHPGFSAAP